MPPPTPLAIATSSLTRLMHEESSYTSELASQISRTEKLEASLRNANGDDGDGAGNGDGNAEWRVRQERKAIEETKAVFPSLQARIVDAVARVERELEAVKGSGKEGSGSGEEIKRAEEAVGKAREREREREGKREGA